MDRHRNVGFASCPRCQRGTCRQPACAFSRFCKMHGGALKARAKPSPQRVAARLGRKAIRAAAKAGQVPPELTALPIWRICLSRWQAHRLPELLAAWHSPDRAVWGRTVADIERAATPPEKRT